jgi:hypothetical protein
MTHLNIRRITQYSYCREIGVMKADVDWDHEYDELGKWLMWDLTNQERLPDAGR